jgi:hypothetical protein
MSIHPHHQSLRGSGQRPGPAGIRRQVLAAGRGTRSWPGLRPKATARAAVSRSGALACGCPLPAGLDQLIRLGINLTGAAGAALFARASILFYLHTHSLIGGLFVIEQAWFVVAFLIRRPERAISRRLASWLVAFGGTFAGVLFRPAGAHPPWGSRLGSVCSWPAWRYALSRC